MMKDRIALIQKIIRNLDKLDEHFLKCVFVYTFKLAEQEA